MFRMPFSCDSCWLLYSVPYSRPYEYCITIGCQAGAPFEKISNGKNDRGVGFSYLEIFVNYQRIVYVRAGTYSYLILLHIVHTTVEQLVYGTGQL